MMQHADLMSTCTELEAERKKAVSESRLLRDELHRQVLHVLYFCTFFSMNLHIHVNVHVYCTCECRDCT